MRAALLPLLLGAWALAWAAPACAQSEQPPAWNGELRAYVEAQQVNGRGPLAEATRLAPGLAAPPRDALVLDAGLRGQWRFLSADFYLREQRAEGGGRAHDTRANELYAGGNVPASAADGLAWSAGKKIVSWDVGHGFRPNDVVQQEPRRRLLQLKPEGRPLLQLEGFNLDSAWSLVWVNPQHLGAGLARSFSAQESALALRTYRHAGAADWHGFIRWGERTQASLGAALAWVASDSVELHASARWLRRHDAVTADAAAPLVAPGNPWHAATLGATSQWLLGGSWTNAAQVSVLAELWHDGTAPPDAAWSAWGARNAALAALGAQPGLPSPLRLGVAGNLAWQSTPWGGQNLRRDNALLRLSWRHEGWEPVLELLVTPRDRGRSLTAALAWQGDRWRIEGGFRRYSGPDGAVLAQLPLRRTGYLAATWAF